MRLTSSLSTGNLGWASLCASAEKFHFIHIRPYFRLVAELKHPACSMGTESPYSSQAFWRRGFLRFPTQYPIRICKMDDTISTAFIHVEVSKVPEYSQRQYLAWTQSATYVGGKRIHAVPIGISGGLCEMNPYLTLDWLTNLSLSLVNFPLQDTPHGPTGSIWKTNINLLLSRSSISTETLTSWYATKFDVAFPGSLNFRDVAFLQIPTRILQAPGGIGEWSFVARRRSELAEPPCYASPSSAITVSRPHIRKTFVPQLVYL